MPGVPVDCTELSKSNFDAYNATYALFAANMIVGGYQPKQVAEIVKALLNAGADSEQIAQSLLGASIIKPGTPLADATAAIKAGLDRAKDPNWEGWTCCYDSETGQYFPYHQTKGWDRNVPC